MKNETILLVLFLTSITQLTGQQLSKSPRDVDEAVQLLDKSLSKKTKKEIRLIDSDSLIHWYWDSRVELEIMEEWFYKTTRHGIKKDTKLRKYYKKKGLKIPSDMIEVVLKTYQAKVKRLSIEHDEILKPFQIRQQKHSNEDKIRFVTDSLRGVYIPKDLDDCFKTLDKIYSDSIKIKIAKLSENKFLSYNHFSGLGSWSRNNWQLWGGSRLSKYFNSIGIYHPDDMSGIVMTSYYRYLKKEDIYLDEQINYYQEYWKNLNKGQDD